MDNQKAPGDTELSDETKTNITASEQSQWCTVYKSNPYPAELWNLKPPICATSDMMSADSVRVIKIT